MKMNPINHSQVGAGRAVKPEVKQVTPASSQKATSRNTSDSVNVSDEARRLLEQSSKADRQSRIDAARAKLESGQLNTPQAAERAADALLRSGDLKRVSDGE